MGMWVSGSTMRRTGNSSMRLQAAVAADFGQKKARPWTGFLMIEQTA
jgi:hypothetical protein